MQSIIYNKYSILELQSADSAKLFSRDSVINLSNLDSHKIPEDHLTLLVDSFTDSLIILSTDVRSINLTALDTLVLMRGGKRVAFLEMINELDTSITDKLVIKISYELVENSDDLSVRNLVIPTNIHENVVDHYSNKDYLKYNSHEIDNSDLLIDSLGIVKGNKEVNYMSVLNAFSAIHKSKSATEVEIIDIFLSTNDSPKFYWKCKVANQVRYYLDGTELATINSSKITGFPDSSYKFIRASTDHIVALKGHDLYFLHKDSGLLKSVDANHFRSAFYKGRIVLVRITDEVNEVMDLEFMHDHLDYNNEYYKKLSYHYLDSLGGTMLVAKGVYFNGSNYSYSSLHLIDGDRSTTLSTAGGTLSDQFKIINRDQVIDTSTKQVSSVISTNNAEFVPIQSIRELSNIVRQEGLGNLKLSSLPGFVFCYNDNSIEPY